MANAPKKATVTAEAEASAKATAAAAAQREAKKKAEAEAEAKAAEIVTYESREKEPHQFVAAGYTATRNYTNGRIEWEVPADDVERFEQHFFFTNGRIIRKRG